VNILAKRLDFFEADVDRVIPNIKPTHEYLATPIPGPEN
jgi:hypothetical protein